ncbi:hypothetical protein OESDEN_19840 [Oesophagostomum dentatum]|uniref:Uncharacterized protein n=1 Tax=Oesophagostomum dentatum TaxID=61180 RepID=A0A0B1SB68_OESDE|nr:hypothetical protein OESDEN_19840 [Oesophagostomum dentatum]
MIDKIPCTAKVSEAFEKSTGNKTSEEQMGIMQKSMHNTETRFYRVVQYEDPKPLLVPVIYAAEDCSSEQPVIVMQDYRDCHVADHRKGFSEKQLFAIVDQIASTQAFSVMDRKATATLQSDSNKELISRSGPQLLSICRSLLAAMPEKLSCIKVCF